MKYRLLDLLQPLGGNSILRVVSKEERQVPFRDILTSVKCTHFCSRKNKMVEEGGITPEDCNECFTREIIDGALTSETGGQYPIVNGIPRVFSGAMRDFLRKNKETFSLEWKMFQFGERNWGQDLDFRKRLFLQGMGLPEEDLKGKLIFDAGCGSGVLSIAMANDFGMEVLALDLATGIEKAYEYNTNPYVYFVQASVLEPPVRDNVADFVYCAGVLVALPDARDGFEVLPRCLRPGGRYITWFYHPVDRQHHPHDLHKMRLYCGIRRITTRLPIRVQYFLYLLWTGAFLLKRRVSNLLTKTRDDRTWRERMQGFVDMFSPVYQHRHSEEEVLNWYKEIGFTCIEIGYREKYGFASRGDKPQRT